MTNNTNIFESILTSDEMESLFSLRERIHNEYVKRIKIINDFNLLYYDDTIDKPPTEYPDELDRCNHTLNLTFIQNMILSVKQQDEKFERIKKYCQYLQNKVLEIETLTQNYFKK